MVSRSLALNGEINRRSARRIIKGLRRFAKSSRKPIYLFINSRKGGYWDETTKICETILALKAPVITIGLDAVLSSAAAIFACGSLRLVFKDFIFGYHKIWWEVDRSRVGNKMTDDDLLKLVEKLRSDTKEYVSYCTRRLSSHLCPCKFTPKQLLSRISKLKKMKKECYIFCGEEARQNGFADACIKSCKEILCYGALLLQKRAKR